MDGSVWAVVPRGTDDARRFSWLSEGTIAADDLYRSVNVRAGKPGRAHRARDLATSGIAARWAGRGLGDGQRSGRALVPRVAPRAVLLAASRVVTARAGELSAAENRRAIVPGIAGRARGSTTRAVPAYHATPGAVDKNGGRRALVTRRTPRAVRCFANCEGAWSTNDGHPGWSGAIIAWRARGAKPVAWHRVVTWWTIHRGGDVEAHFARGADVAVGGGHKTVPPKGASDRRLIRHGTHVAHWAERATLRPSGAVSARDAGSEGVVVALWVENARLA